MELSNKIVDVFPDLETFKGETMRTQTVKTDSLNTKLLLKTLLAFKKGDFSARLPGDWTGEAGKIAGQLRAVAR